MAIEKLTTLPWFLQLLIFVGIAGMLVLGVEMLYFRDLGSQIDEQQTQLAALKSELANIHEVERQHHAFQSANAKSERQLADLHTVLPSDRNSDVLIRQIQGIAGQTNVRIMRLVAKQSTKRETGAAQDASGKKGEFQPQLYSELPFTMELSGSYLGLSLFFDRVAHLERIVNVSDLEIATVTNASKVHVKAQPPKGLNDTVVASCTVTAYFQSEP
jgi:Tfp pilus assembly protein PilO